jgi:hypothetical protein
MALKHDVVCPPASPADHHQLDRDVGRYVRLALFSGALSVDLSTLDSDVLTVNGACDAEHLRQQRGIGYGRHEARPAHVDVCAMLPRTLFGP